MNINLQIKKISTLLLVLTILSGLSGSLAYADEMDETNSFFNGFVAYQHSNYSSSIQQLEKWLKEYPDSSIRDLGLYWLAQSYYRVGNQRDAARYMALFFREYPQNPLIAIVDEDLKDLVMAYENGQKLPSETSSSKEPAPTEDRGQGSAGTPAALEPSR